MFPVNRIRKDFTEEEVKILNESYDNGMISSGKKCSSQIADVAKRLNCEEDRIKSWIGNRRAKNRPKCNSEKYQRTKSKVQGPNGYSFFVGTQERGTMEKEEFLKKTATAYNLLTSEEKKLFQEKAKEIRKDPMKGMTREKAIAVQVDIILRACTTLSDLGYEIGGIGFDPKESRKSQMTFGSSMKTAGFFSNIEEKFCQIMGQKNIQLPEQSSRKKLRIIVQDKFNDAWRKAGGEKKVPYEAIGSNKIIIKVEGLPNDLKFTKPSNYTIAQLKKISVSDISMQIRDNKDQDVEKVSSDGVLQSENEILVDDILTDVLIQQQECNDENHDDEVDEILTDVLIQQQECNDENHGNEDPSELDLFVKDLEKRQTENDQIRNKKKRKRNTTRFSNKKRKGDNAKVYDIKTVLEWKESEVLVEWMDSTQSWIPIDNIVNK